MDWSKNTIKFLSAACIAGFLISATACGDDSSGGSPASPDTPSSSDGQGPDGSQVPNSSGSDVPQGGDNPVPDASAGFNTDPAKAGLSITPDADGFYDIGDVYKAVPAESKIVFVLRHAERESGLGQESPLTQVGVQQGLDAGKKLAGGDDSFYYASTDFIRTKETAQNIAKGRGETAQVVTWDAINGGYFLTVPSDSLDALVSSRGGSFKYVSQWAYGVPFTNKYLVEHGLNDCFYDLFERGEQFIREVILANISNWKRVSVLISHDLLLEPLVVYVSARSIDLKSYESYRWINYLAGIAVVQDASGQVTLLPVRGTDSGVLNTRETYGNK